MAKKQKSKSRLDKYYYLAKDHGFRSRATFKLIQLNKKYNFFQNANVCIDLCAAPGGWLQAASKFMPLSSIKVGVDLDPIKSVPGCSTIVADITTHECRVKLEKEIKHMKADIVLNDGAPNVGGNWSRDAFTQSELVLYALKLATEFLKVGGWFVTKVFRSSDYSALLYVMQHLFHRVEATKPLASRQVSAEIFVVCKGFKGGDIDPKFLDPKHALKQLEDEEDMKMNSIKSIKALLEASTGRHRSGYYSESLFKSQEFEAFIDNPNPYQFFYETNKITTNSPKSKEYLEVNKKPIDWEALMGDLKVLGKTELQTLLNWREKIRTKVMKKKKNDLVKEKPDEIFLKEDYEKKKLEEIDNEISKAEKYKKKKIEIAERKKEKNELRQKISFLKENNQFEADGTEFDQGLFDYLKRNKINIEDLDYKTKEQVDLELNAELNQLPVEEIELSDFSEDEYYAMMNEYVEENIKNFNEDRDDLAQKRAEQKKNKKGKKIKSLEENLSDIEENNKIVTEKNEEKKDSDLDSDDFEDDDEDNMSEEVNFKDLKKTNKQKDNKTKEIPQGEGTFINPLAKGFLSKSKPEIKKEENKLAKKSKEDLEEENESSDSDEEDNKLSSKKKKELENKAIEYVERENKNESEYDSDEIAEIRAIAKKMLRKKDRLNIFASSYNRYAFNDIDDAPEWFKDDEVQHNKANKPVTKEEIMAEKEVLKQINDRMPKKVIEAKNRKKKKMMRQMDKIKKKAQVISNQEEIGEGSKIRQIEKLYKRELAKNKESKKYIVVKSAQKVGRNSRSVKYVDKRLKKDKRAQKRTERKNKEGHKIKNRNKQKSFNKKQQKAGGKKSNK